MSGGEGEEETSRKKNGKLKPNKKVKWPGIVIQIPATKKFLKN